MLAGLLAGLALAAPAAAPPQRTCAERAEAGGGPIPFRIESPAAVRIGPVIFSALNDMKRLTAADLRRKQGRLPFHKTALIAKAGTVVTLSIAPASRGFARVAYDNGNRGASGSLARHPVSVVIRACQRDEPAFSYDGVVGPATAFPGGFITDGSGDPGCVSIELRVRGKQRTYRRTVPFGAIRC